MPLWFRVARIWLPIAIAITALAGLTYLSVQQAYRNGLDDPQLQLATDGAAALDAGASPASLIASPGVDAEKDLAPFVVVFGANDGTLASGGSLGTEQPKPPTGVLATARAKGIDRVTWQPKAGVRIATVSVATKNGRVVFAGRNMRAVESRIDDLTRITGIAWALSVAAVLVGCVVLEYVGLGLDARAR